MSWAASENEANDRYGHEIITTDSTIAAKADVNSVN